MPDTKEGRRRAKAGLGILPMALSATSAAGLMLAFLWHDASHYGAPATGQAVRLAQDALHGLGYDWARVTVSGKTVHLMGRAPDDGARVMAFDTTKRALRDLMGKDAVIDDIRSHLGLASKAADAHAQLANRVPGGPGLDIAQLLPPPTPLVHTYSLAASLNVTSSVDGASMAAKEKSTHETHVAQAESKPDDSPSAQTPTDDAAELSAQAAVAPAAPPSETASISTAAESIQFKPASDTATMETAAVEAPASAAPLNTRDACAQSFASVLLGKTIGFGRDSAEIEKESRPLLDKLASIAKRCKAYRFTVEGHTDLTGSRSHNLELSRKRAEAVRWALIDRGVDLDHISAEGYGASRPLEQAVTDAANAKNRRIMINVIEPTAKASAKSASSR